MNELARAIIRAVAGDGWPGSALFMLTAHHPGPEANVKPGDRVVYAEAVPKPGEAVVWSNQHGQTQFGRLGRFRLVRTDGRWHRPARILGVIVAAVTSLN